MTARLKLKNNINGLSCSLSDQIVRLIAAYKRPEKIIVFGSRSSADFKRTSDIDIAILGKEWTDRDINIIKDNLEESIKSPLKFDVINFYAVEKEALKKNILKKGRVIYG
jgi:predicted nucleotidyltransferase